MPTPPDPDLPDHPEPLPPARGRGFLAERLLSINSLVSLAMLSWSVAALRRPGLLPSVLRTVRRLAPWLVGDKPTRTSRGGS
ncbi:MAG: hypothetical protein ACRDGS_14105 [Chloroflexota bacterium]